jgi:UPF0176 protein
MKLNIENISHYSFFSIENPEEKVVELKAFFQSTPVRGSFLIASEGINFNAAVEKDWQFAEKFSPILKSWGCQEFDYHFSYTSEYPFTRLKIIHKSEIVALKADRPVNVQKNKGIHLPPDEFEKVVQEHLDKGDDSPYFFVDMRNDFEYAMGSFKGARAAGTTTFKHFKNTLGMYPKDKKVVMFCTGGVRCEKASAYMKENGFQEIYQLEGGVLRYLSEKGTGLWEGQCFVFDSRRTITEI